MMTQILRALLAHWRHRPVQLLSLLAGLVLATALWSGVQAINAEARASYGRAASLAGQAGLGRIVARDGGLLGDTDFVALRRAGWIVSPVLEARLRNPGPMRVRVIGVEPVTALANGTTSAGPEAGSAALLALITPPGEALAAPETIAALAGVAGLPPLRESAGLPPGRLVMDIGQAQALLAMEGAVSHMVVAADQPLGRAPLAEVLPGAVLKTGPVGGADLARLTDSFHLNLTAFGLLSFAVGLFIVHGAIGLAFEQRRPLFRTLRAIGAPLRGLVAALLVEVLVLALITGLAGVALGYVIAAALLPDVAATLRGLYGAAVPGTLSLSPLWWLGGLGVALAGALIAAAQSLWRLTRLGLLAPAQPRAWSRAALRAQRWQGAVAGALAALALGLALTGTGLVAGFATLGAMLLSAALALPLVLSGLLALAARRARGDLARWFWADARHQLPGLSLALMALLLAVAANIGVSTMVGSFRQTFTGWLDQRLASELYVEAVSPADVPALRTFLNDRAEAVLPIWVAEGALPGGAGAVYGVADHATYRDNWPMLSIVPGGWDAVAAGDAVLINEQLSRRQHLTPGDTLTLPGGPDLPIVGVYSDYGNPRGQAMIGLALFDWLYPGSERRRFALRTDTPEDLRAALVGEFGLPAANIVDQAAIKRQSLQVFDRTFTVTAALNALTLGVAGVAILSSMLTLAAMRLPQLAPVWALGLTRRRLAGLELARALALTALTALVALPVGLLLAWLLLAVVNVAAFGWRLPMTVFPGDWLRLFALALLAGGLAALWPALRLLRLPPAALLRVFANER